MDHNVRATDVWGWDSRIALASIRQDVCHQLSSPILAVLDMIRNSLVITV